MRQAFEPMACSPSVRLESLKNVKAGVLDIAN
jgi:hypothetical protein